MGSEVELLTPEALAICAPVRSPMAESDNNSADSDEDLDALLAETAETDGEEEQGPQRGDAGDGGEEERREEGRRRDEVRPRTVERFETPRMCNDTIQAAFLAGKNKIIWV